MQLSILYANKMFIFYNRNLKKKWEERSQMIGQLEERVVKMKENFDVKEEKLKNERDKALKSAK